MSLLSNFSAQFPELSINDFYDKKAITDND